MVELPLVMVNVAIFAASSGDMWCSWDKSQLAIAWPAGFDGRHTSAPG
jgi:hypothetical protein